MGYFANGMDGDLYEEKYCNQCAHNDPECYCPVMALHEVWSDEQIPAMNDRHQGKAPSDTPSEAKRVALETFIPTTQDGFNGKCTMFYPRPPQPPTRQQEIMREVRRTILGDDAER